MYIPTGIYILYKSDIYIYIFTLSYISYIRGSSWEGPPRDISIKKTTTKHANNKKYFNQVLIRTHVITPQIFHLLSLLYKLFPKQKSLANCIPCQAMPINYTRLLNTKSLHQQFCYITLANTHLKHEY